MATFTFNNTDSNGDASDTNNWDTLALPTSADDVVLAATVTTGTVTCHDVSSSGGSISGGTWTIGGDVGGVNVSGGSLTIAGLYIGTATWSGGTHSGTLTAGTGVTFDGIGAPGCPIISIGGCTFSTNSFTTVTLGAGDALVAAPAFTTLNVPIDFNFGNTSTCTISTMNVSNGKAVTGTYGMTISTVSLGAGASIIPNGSMTTIQGAAGPSINAILVSAGGNYYPPADSDVKDGIFFGVGNTGDEGTYTVTSAYAG